MFVGIDIAKQKFDVCLLSSKTSFATFTNNQEGFKKFLSWIKKHKADNAHFCMEATGTYGHSLALFLHSLNLKLSAVNPFCIKSYAKSKLSRIKTDKADSQLIAEYCQVYQPLLWHKPPEDVFKLQELSRYRDALIKQSCQIQNQLENVISEEVKTSTLNILEKLNEEIQDIENKLSEITELNSELKEQKELIKTIKGIAEESANMLLAEIGDIKKYNSARELASYAGITPHIRQSGSSLNSKGHISKIGNRRLRAKLYMPALSAIKYNPVIQVFVKRLKENGKKGKVIVCAVIRKLLHIVYGVLKNKIPFDTNYKNLAFSS